MRRYLQLIIVITLFSFAVFVRHIREPHGQAGLVARSAETLNSHVLSLASPTSQPVPTPEVSQVVTPTADTPVPTVTATEVSPTPIVAATPEATEPTSTSVVTSGHTTPATTWPYLFKGAVFKDGPFTGREIRTSYGYVQVTLVMQKGWIEDVIIVQYPRANSTAEKKSAEVMPRLVAQALEKQDWDVDIISGATQTWQGFQRAMVDALTESERK